MGFSLATNIDAMTALLNLNQTNNALSQSIQRLSTGLRINSPADDPSGFLTSNSLQSQVNGINQAVSNIQNATNQTKTATSALTQVNTLVANIRAAALDAQNTPANAGNDQVTIQQAIASINNIAQNTSFGGQSLLNGSAGITAAVTDGAKLGGISIGGNFGTGTTQAGNITITVTQAATSATVTGTVVYGSTTSTIASGGATGGGSITLNGQTITANASDTVQTFLNNINLVSNQTGVTAGFSGGKIVLTQTISGSKYSIAESETASLITGGTGATVSGLNAIASVSASTSIGGVTSTQTVTFTGGQQSGQSGLRLTDSFGNSIVLTPAGNSTSVTNAAVANITSGSVQFQIGPNAGQTASLAYPNVVASSLGNTAVAGQSLATIDVTTPTGAANAILIATQAAQQVIGAAAQIGSFQTNVLTATQNYLSSEATNISASVSNITSVNIAQESANLANLQLLQQSGTSALYTAQNLAKIYLRLLP